MTGAEVNIRFSAHAEAQWAERARNIRASASKGLMLATFARARPEVRLSPAAKRELFYRKLKYGSKTVFLVADGWRFVVAGTTCVTIERVKPHENYRR